MYVEKGREFIDYVVSREDELQHSSTPSINEALAYRKIKVGSLVKFNDWGDLVVGTVTAIDNTTGRVTVLVRTINGVQHKNLTKSYVVPSQKPKTPLNKQPNLLKQLKWR